MKAILTVIGADKVGIVAGVTQKLAELQINILDISQTIMGKSFTMIMLCDLSQSKKEFGELKEALNKKGEELGVTITIQREEIFDAMHRI
ncbi:MAG: ACT domain-containing protein [Saezia sp.]